MLAPEVALGNDESELNTDQDDRRISHDQIQEGQLGSGFQKERSQVYVNTAFETVRVEFETIEEFGRQIEDRWGLRPGHYRLHPTPRENQSGVGYRLTPLVKGGYNSDDEDDDRDRVVSFPGMPSDRSVEMWERVK
jgi:hypothetical protein